MSTDDYEEDDLSDIPMAQEQNNVKTTAEPAISLQKKNAILSMSADSDSDIPMPITPTHQKGNDEEKKQQPVDKKDLKNNPTTDELDEKMKQLEGEISELKKKAPVKNK
ncbi:hypothetical protein AKO1_004974, partial [Acrasis kona]